MSRVFCYYMTKRNEIVIKRILNMSPVFSQEKRERLTQELLAVGMSLFGHYGVRKTSIDELCRECGIAKGSFYSFYPSKIHLFLDILRSVRDEVGREIQEKILPASESCEKSLEKLILLAVSLPERFPVIAEFSDQSLRSEILSVLSEEEFDLHDYSPLPIPDFFLKYWERRGELFDITSDQLFALLETLISVRISFPGEPMQEGLAKIVEMLTVGAAGYIRRG